MSELFPAPLPQTDNRCKDCEHAFGLEYPSGRRIYYCDINGDNRTHNRKRKIRLKDMACGRFTPEATE